jgi:hypothetical protein
LSIGEKRKKRGTLRRWRSLILVCLVLGTLAAVDLWVKSAPQTAGYCPTDSSYTITAQDFGRFWQSLERTPAVERFTEEVPRPLAAFELAVCQATGIRPTASRWRLWMGKRFLWASTEEGSGLCVYPGLLLRGATIVRRAIGGSPDEKGVCTFRDYFYAWRDGFLILSESRAYVEATLTAEPVDMEDPGAPDEALLQWHVAPEGSLRLHAANDLHVSGEVRLPVTHATTPMTLADAWPENPLVAITASSWLNLHVLWTPIHAFLQESSPWRQAAPLAQLLKDTWGIGDLPDNWHRSFGECSFALLDVDVSEATPVPGAACILRSSQPVRGAHPLGPLLGPLPAIPYEWQGYAGVLTPLVGEKLAICLGRCEKDWLVTTRESLMTGLVGQLRELPPREADLALRIDWEKAGQNAERLLQRAGEFELFPGKNAEEVNRDYGGVARGLSRWGVLEITGQARGDVLVFEGFLAQVQEEEESE